MVLPIDLSLPIVTSTIVTLCFFLVSLLNILNLVLRFEHLCEEY